MKNNFKKSARICCGLLFLLITKSFSQEEIKFFKITPEITKQIIENKGIGELAIYPASYKDVTYILHVDGQVNTLNIIR